MLSFLVRQMCLFTITNEFLVTTKVKEGDVIQVKAKGLWYHLSFRLKISKLSWFIFTNKARNPELQIKKNSCQTLGPASKRVLPDLSTFCQTYFFFGIFSIFHFQYSKYD